MPAVIAPEDDENPDDAIQRILNDAKRSDLEERYGARFIRVGTTRLPPEIESDFLDYISEFHRQLETAENISVRAFVEFPVARPIADLAESEVEAELEHLLDHMSRFEVFVHFPDYVRPSEAYRFLVEVLLDAEMMDIRIPGMRNHFDYEEFER
jgi:hypothetical protein